MVRHTVDNLCLVVNLSYIYLMSYVGNLIKLYLMSGTDYFHKQNDYNLHIMYFISCGV